MPTYIVGLPDLFFIHVYNYVSIIMRLLKLEHGHVRLQGLHEILVCFDGTSTHRCRCKMLT